MKPIHISILSALVVLLLFSVVLASNSHASKASTNKTIKGDGFAVLELFTSEGCSSCPPADELLAKVQKEMGNKPVYILAYHVDYWDRLGWKDIFSHADYTQRQYQYAQKLNAQVYTPQLVVNGKTEFVGSNEAATAYALKSALDGVATTTLSLQGKQQAGKMTIGYQVAGNTEGSELTIAVVQKKGVNHIERGENEGLTLSHIQIVRQLQSFNLKDKKGELPIMLPKAFNNKSWEIIGLLQNPQTKAIQAANRVVLSESGIAL